MISTPRGFEYGVLHGICSESSTLISWVNPHLDGFPLPVEELLKLGSVYVNHQRVQTNVQLKSNDYIRLHRRPRRFPVDKISWKSRLVFSNADFTVIHKPGGIPCHPTVDNTEENVIKALEKVTGETHLITHRLDVPTQGLLILAKNPSSQRQINLLFKERKVKKIYRAWSLNFELPLGLWTHYMRRSPRAPKEIVKVAENNSELCEMILHQKISRESFCEYEIELLTGRTHQIRAQLAFEGGPICGDTAYGGADLPGKTQAEEISSDSSISLWCTHLSFPWGDKNYSFDLPKTENSTGIPPFFSRF